MSRAGMLTLVVLLGIAALVYFGMQGTADVKCRVCMTWNGEQICQESAGATRAEAVDRARTAICQILATGRADNIKCGRMEPDSVECW
ncbi:hypothetical protein DRQ53_07000 [bacterium]|nr:MAG: hypothetical protein DRQ32_09675 [bacterium]RKZ16179.1 MAG: hypothetical protein DRQ53_07000 [bacterium]